MGYLVGIELLIETECFEEEGIGLFPRLLQQFWCFGIFVQVKLVGLRDGI
jgi:hypothetical protein